MRSGQFEEREYQRVSQFSTSNSDCYPPCGDTSLVNFVSPCCLAISHDTVSVTWSEERLYTSTIPLRSEFIWQLSRLSCNWTSARQALPRRLVVLKSRRETKFVAASPTTKRISWRCLTLYRHSGDKRGIRFNVSDVKRSGQCLNSHKMSAFCLLLIVSVHTLQRVIWAI